MRPCWPCSGRRCQPEVALVAVRVEGKAVALVLADELGDTFVATRRMEDLSATAGEALGHMLREKRKWALARDASHRPMSDYAKLRREWLDGTLAPHERKEAPRKRVPNLAGHADAAPLYGPDDLEALGFDPARDLGFPGRAAVHARRAAEHVPRPPLDDAAVRRASARRESRTSATTTCSSQGQTGLSVAFDLPTQMGRDSDDPRAHAARSAASASPSTRSRTCARC